MKSCWTPATHQNGRIFLPIFKLIIALYKLCRFHSIIFNWRSNHFQPLWSHWSCLRTGEKLPSLITSCVSSDLQGQIPGRFWGFISAPQRCLLVGKQDVLKKVVLCSMKGRIVLGAGNGMQIHGTGSSNLFEWSTQRTQTGSEMRYAHNCNLVLILCTSSMMRADSNARVPYYGSNQPHSRWQSRTVFRSFHYDGTSLISVMHTLFYPARFLLTMHSFVKGFKRRNQCSPWTPHRPFPVMHTH